jgi:hypothetical protein
MKCLVKMIKSIARPRISYGNHIIIRSKSETVFCILASESRLEGVNRANLKFTNLITTTSRVSVRNMNESERG